MRTMAAGEFKAKCLAVMDEVQATGQPVLITKRGKPVVMLTEPVKQVAQKVSVDSIFNSLRDMISVPEDIGDLTEPIFPLEDWDHLKDDPLPPA